VAASGHKWAQVAATSRKWPPLGQVAASGCLDDKYQPEWHFFFSQTAFFQDFFTT
jgi:hypothetical protein